MNSFRRCLIAAVTVALLTACEGAKKEHAPSSPSIENVTIVIDQTKVG